MMLNGASTESILTRIVVVNHSAPEQPPVKRGQRKGVTGKAYLGLHKMTTMMAIID